MCPLCYTAPKYRSNSSFKISFVEGQQHFATVFDVKVITGLRPRDIASNCHTRVARALLFTAFFASHFCTRDAGIVNFSTMVPSLLPRIMAGSKVYWKQYVVQTVNDDAPAKCLRVVTFVERQQILDKFHDYRRERANKWQASIKRKGRSLPPHFFQLL